ncbi:MAG: cyclase family protein [Bryobacteraceae bacterium]
MDDLFQLLQRSRVYDLAQSYFVGMPHYPTHPPYLFSLTKKHGDLVLKGGVSSAADALSLGSHVGTHIDALCHFSLQGKLHGGADVSALQSYSGGIQHLSIDTVQPIVRRGVLLDIARLNKMDALPADFAITPDHLDAAVRDQGLTVARGDVVLLRTGWAKYWDDPVQFVAGGEGSQTRGPGPEIAAAQWLSKRATFAAGSDTVSFEKVPSSMPVHVHLLVESGIHIIENLNLEELASDRVHEFLFLALPLKIRGGTGSPIRPVALIAP